MNQIETEVLVIGGGATGTGVAWDAALRGFKVVLVERRDLVHGTSGRFHGHLHSGGRYAVKDPRSAIECITENKILRHTHAQCIEDTSGFVMVTPEDEGDYVDKFWIGCQEAGIPCVEVPLAEALKREPLLNPQIRRVFEVPDGSADSFLAAHATAQAARQLGAQILTYHSVTGLIVDGTEGDRHVRGARVLDEANGEELIIRADLVVNATGAWGGQIAQMAGVKVSLMASKGTMVALNHRVVNTVVSRCRMPTDGDCIVPSHTVAIIGTTSVTVSDPEKLRIETWEVQKMLDSGDSLVPGFSRARVLRAWAGVRPLFQESYSSDGREVTRSLTLLDHSERDGVSGFLTVAGGKWTTFRLMAEATVDKICKHLETERSCKTAFTQVPGAEKGHNWLGHRLQEVEEQNLQGELICECELVTRTMVERAVRTNPTMTLDDLRRDVRLGKGPCQGGFCTYRAAGIMQEMITAGTWTGKPELTNPNLLLRDFLQERWKGLTPILWGRQLQQERLSQLIYLSLMNVGHLPDAQLASPLSEFYHYDTRPKEAKDGAGG